MHGSARRAATLALKSDVQSYVLSRGQEAPSGTKWEYNGKEFKELLYAAPPLLCRMVEAGLLGPKLGRGFHTYNH